MIPARSRLAAAALSFAVFIAAPAHAQDATEQDELLFQNGAFVIEGKVQKPEVTVLVRRENLEKGFDLELDESFLKRIVDALEQEPF